MATASAAAEAAAAQGGDGAGREEEGTEAKPQAQEEVGAASAAAAAASAATAAASTSAAGAREGEGKPRKRKRSRFSNRTADGEGAGGEGQMHAPPPPPPPPGPPPSVTEAAALAAAALLRQQQQPPQPQPGLQAHGGQAVATGQVMMAQPAHVRMVMPAAAPTADQLRAQPGLADLPPGFVVDRESKLYRELFLGNRTEAMSDTELREFLGAAMLQVGLNTLPRNPILAVRCSPRFAFLELRTIEETTSALCLNGIPFKDTTLTVARPSKYPLADPPMMAWSELLSRYVSGELKAINAGPESSVLMFMHMVSRAQLLDDAEVEDIEDDVREECEKHATVREVRIPRPQATDSGDPATHATVGALSTAVAIGEEEKATGVGRVFVHFASAADAKNALLALKGRVFGDDIVDAKFFPEDAFLAGRLADPPHATTNVLGLTTQWR